MRFNSQRKLLVTAVSAVLLQACAGNPTTAPMAPEEVEEKAPMAVVEPVSERPDRGEVKAFESVADQPPRKAIPQVNRRGSLPGMPLIKEQQPSISVSPGEDVVQLDYEQVDLRQVLEEIADALGVSVVIDSTIADKVTLRTAESRPLKHADLWPLLRLLVSEAGVTLEKRGGVYFAKKATSALPTRIGVSKAVAGAPAEAMQITPLRYVSVESALTVLKPLVEPGGRVVSLPSLNLVGIVGSPELLSRVDRLLSLVDADPFIHRGMRLYPLSSAKAADVAKDLEAIIKAVEGEGSAYQLVPLDRINAVLVVSPPNRGFEEVERWLSILDSGEEEGGEKVFIYRVKNLAAKSLASTLSDVFKKDDSAASTSSKKEESSGEAKEEKPKGLGEMLEEAAAKVQAKSQEKAAAEAGAASAALKVTIVADEDTNSLLVKATPRDYKQLLETISELDRVPQEVMINVVIAEVTLGEDNRFGVEWSALNSSGRSSISTSFGLAGGGLTGFVLNQASNRLTTLLNILDAENNLRVLSRPSILVRDNQEAVIKVGSEEPVLTRVTTSDSTVGGTSQINNDVQYRDTGIILTVTPHINEDGIINMEVHQEISQVGDKSGTLDLPSFTNREVKTSAVVRDGAALILGGIIQDRVENTNNGIPGLKNLPGIGGLFSDQTKNTERTELVLIMIPELINPHQDNAEVMNRMYGRLVGVAELLEMYGIHEMGWN